MKEREKIEPSLMRDGPDFSDGHSANNGCPRQYTLRRFRQVVLLLIDDGAIISAYKYRIRGWRNSSPPRSTDVTSRRTKYLMLFIDVWQAAAMMIGVTS